VDWEKKRRFTKKKPITNSTAIGKDSPWRILVKKFSFLFVCLCFFTCLTNNVVYVFKNSFFSYGVKNDDFVWMIQNTSLFLETRRKNDLELNDNRKLK
jgi:hypothetical protein